MFDESVLNNVTLTITQEHIANGQRKSCGYCPIALAVRDHLNDTGTTGVDVVVTSENIVLESDDQYVRYRYSNGAEVSRFIKIFDRIGPSSFTDDFTLVTILTRIGGRIQ